MAIATLLSLISIPVLGQLESKEEPSSTEIDQSLIVGVWIAHPFDGPGTKPRIEFKKSGSVRMLMQDDTEMKAKWEWKDPATIALKFPEREKVIESKISKISKDEMTMVSARGRETKYVRIDSWRAKEPK